MTLVEFLRARLDEDERAALNAPPGPWHYDRKRFTVTCDGYPVASWRHEGKLTDGSPLLDRTGEYMERFDPARVLAEVDAKRRILDDYSRTIRIRDEAAARIKDAGPANADPEDLDTWDRAQREASILEGPVKALALPYAAHPEYDPAWRPGIDTRDRTADPDAWRP